MCPKSIFVVLCLHTTRLLSTKEPEGRQCPLTWEGNNYIASQSPHLETITLLVPKRMILTMIKMWQLNLTPRKNSYSRQPSHTHTHTHTHSHSHHLHWKAALGQYLPRIFTDTTHSFIPLAHILREWFQRKRLHSRPKFLPVLPTVQFSCKSCYTQGHPPAQVTDD